MRIVAVILVMCMVLSGCGAETVLETVADEMVQVVAAQPREIHVELAGDPVLPVMETEEGSLYLCAGYDIMTQVCERGDLEKTVFQISGFAPEELTILETGFGDWTRYDFAWTAVSDGGEQVGRASILDDGNYHYCLSAVTTAERGEECREIWNGIFESFTLS